MKLFKDLLCCVFKRNVKNIFNIKHIDGDIIIKECIRCKKLTIKFFKNIDSMTKTELDNLVSLVNEANYTNEDLKHFLDGWKKHNSRIKTITSSN